MEYHQGCIGLHLGQAAAAAVAVWLPVFPSLGVTVTEVFERCQKWQSLFDGVGETPCSALCRHIAIMLGPGSKSKEKKDGEKGGAADVCILIVDICGLIVAEISF